MKPITIRIDPDLDHQLEAVLPQELQGKRKTELRVATGLRRFLESVSTTDKGTSRPATKRKAG